jgi:phospholipase/carboxylesterase/glyoxalase family protein
VSAAAGLQAYVHRFLPGADPAAPVLVVLHGTGGDENDLIPLGRLLAPSSAVLAPRGNVLENGMPRFFRRFAEGVFDLEDLERRSHELADFLIAARDAYDLSGRALIAAGFSNGANIAASVLLRRPEVFAGALLFRPMVTFTPDSLPRLDGKPVFLSAGRADTMVGRDSPERLAELFRAGGADVTLQWDDEGHALGMDAVRAAREWMARAIGVPRVHTGRGSADS